MPRINVEDSLWGDHRFLKLCISLGSEVLAAGTVVIAWKIAQKYWLPDRKPIPLDRWKASKLSHEIIEVGLARVTPDGVFIAGCEESFAWWFERRDSAVAAGRASAAARKKKYGSAVPLNASNFEREPNARSEHDQSERPPNARSAESERAPNARRTEPNDSERSSSSSSSLSLEKKEEERQQPPPPPPPDPEACIFGEPLIAEFLEAVPARIQKIWVKGFGPDPIWVEAEIKKAASWWESNPSKRKPGDTVPAFVNRWLTKAKKEHEEFCQTGSYPELPIPQKSKESRVEAVYIRCSVCGNDHEAFGQCIFEEAVYECATEGVE